MRLLFVLLVLFSVHAQAQKKLAVTVDDLPGVTRFHHTPVARAQMNQRLLKYFTDYKVPAIGFVISRWLYTNDQPDTNQVAILKQWLNAGMELGNHTYTHKDYNVISFAEYADEVVKGEQIVKPLTELQGKPFQYFRHPFLRKGPTEGKKDSLERFLAKQGYREAPVTVDNYDFMFSRAYDNALLAGDKAAAASVGHQYIDYMMRYMTYYEMQSDSLFGRQIPQTLLIHANSINADYFGRLLAALKQRGYTFVSLDEALQDEAYRSPDRYVGTAGISWLHRWALTRGKRGKFFSGEPEVPAEIQQLANSR